MNRNSILRGINDVVIFIKGVLLLSYSCKLISKLKFEKYSYKTFEEHTDI